MSDGRYSRQILFAPIGAEGQRRIGASHVVLLGCGALGSTMANTLARAGVGRLTIIDPDRLELSNLQRQTLFDEAQAAEGLPKAEAARARLAEINSAVAVEVRTERAGRENLARLVGRPDLVLDATDNFETRYLLNDLCVREGLPWVYGGCAAAYGVCMPILPRETPCLRCLFPEPPPPEHAPTANTVGIIAPIAHAVASLQAAEALKLLSGNRGAVRPVLYTLDLWESNVGTVRLPGPERDCPCCGAGRYDFLEGGR